MGILKHRYFRAVASLVIFISDTFFWTLGPYSWNSRRKVCLNKMFVREFVSAIHKAYVHSRQSFAASSPWFHTNLKNGRRKLLVKSIRKVTHDLRNFPFMKTDLREIGMRKSYVRTFSFVRKIYEYGSRTIRCWSCNFQGRSIVMQEYWCRSSSLLWEVQMGH